MENNKTAKDLGMNPETIYRNEVLPAQKQLNRALLRHAVALGVPLGELKQENLSDMFSLKELIALGFQKEPKG